MEKQSYRNGAQPAFVSRLLKETMQMSSKNAKTHSQQSLRFSNFLTKPDTGLIPYKGKLTLMKCWYCFLYDFLTSLKPSQSEGLTCPEPVELGRPNENGCTWDVRRWE